VEDLGLGAAAGVLVEGCGNDSTASAVTTAAMTAMEMLGAGGRASATASTTERDEEEILM